LGGSDGSGGLVGKLGAQQTSVQTSADTLIAERNARQQSSTFDAAGGFQDASQLFDKTHGLSKDSSTQKEYTDDLTSMFDKTSSSFSNMIQAMVVGGAKGKNAFKDFALSILQNALQVATNKAAEQMLSGMLSLGGSMFGPSVAAGSGGVGGIAGGVAGDVGGFGLGAAGAYQGKVFPKHFDAGGVVSGTAIGRDSVHALIAPGEAILNRSAVSLVGADQINQINAGSLRQNQSVPQVPPPREPDKVNVYVVDKNTTPTLGKKDVLAAVSEDVLAGGATKKLIQQVAMGSR
jgi:lambda family phage tail tape measure protein